MYGMTVERLYHVIIPNIEICKEEHVALCLLYKSRYQY